MPFEADSRATRMGRMGEDAIARMFQRKGYAVFRNCDAAGPGGDKAPMAEGPFANLVMLDLTVMRDGLSFNVEVKTKTAHTWRRQPPGPRDEQGLDLRNWRHYCRIEEVSGIPGLIVFCVKRLGLVIGQTVAVLRYCGRSDSRALYGKDGMMFWAVDDFDALGRWHATVGQARFDFVSDDDDFVLKPQPGSSQPRRLINPQAGRLPFRFHLERLHGIVASRLAVAEAQGNHSAAAVFRRELGQLDLSLAAIRARAA